MILGWRRGLAGDRRGATTMLAAGIMTTAMAGLAFAVDLGAIYHESRRLQGIADAAALSAAGNLATPEAAARDAVAANGWTRPYMLAVVTGGYRADPEIAVDARFSPVAIAGRNAARVTLTADVPLYFGIVSLGRRTLPIARSATATRTDLTAFTIGSRLASVDGGLANALIGALTGSKLSLTAMDYAALLDADVDLLGFADTLRTESKLTAASFDSALATAIAPPRALAVLADTLARSGDAAAAATVRRIAAAGVRGDAVPLARLIDLGPLGAQDRVAPGQAIRVSAFDLMRAELELAGGSRQMKLDLGASVPGLTGTTAYLSIGDRAAGSPWVALTARGEPVVRTAQARLFVDAAARPGGLAGLGVGGVRLPLYVELAEAEAKLAAVSCRRTGARTASLEVRPVIGHAAIAEVQPVALENHRAAPTEAPGRIVAAPLLAVGGRARLDFTDDGWQRVEFTAAEVAARTVRKVHSSSTVQGIAASLVRSMSLDIQFAGFGVGAGAITALVGQALTPVAPAVDQLLFSLTGLLGIHLGEADVRIDGVRCGVAALVA